MKDLSKHEKNIIMCKELKDIEEIVDLAKEEIEKENKNITATLDYEDLKSLITLWYYYCEERMKNLDFSKEWINKSKIYDKLKELDKEFKEHEKRGLHGFFEKIDCGTRIEALKELLED